MKNIFFHLSSIAGIAVLLNLLLRGTILEDALFKGTVTGIAVYGVFSLANIFVKRILESVDNTKIGSFEEDDFDMGANDDFGAAEDEAAPESLDESDEEPVKKAA